MIFVYITNPSEKDAERIARVLLEKHLIACANIFPISSIYRWKGKIVDEKEFVVIAKTSGKNYKAVVAEVEKIHPYKIPCITKIPVRPNEKYTKWMKAQLKIK